ncbi:hypothetical protein DM02DRAFT_662229 [Periconia macrospinosa]|uniref:Uncharacterized protein n=1 Tax=Periconia macrospinosa TaxID=97972 RepID=A0A2V1D559_9PLEO|nr:hypothetical protein DM02DRAFT_662229 [Periconia macrospinosa]
MAPVEPDVVARSNVLPVSLFAAQALLVLGLTSQVLYTTRRAAKSLPPPTTTRGQEPFRRRHAIIFSTLAFLSLTSVTAFAILWRASSYLEWAAEGNHESPGSLWTGWYGTGDEGVGKWRLGDWLSDKNLIVESDAVAVAKPEAFLYTSEHFVGLLASSLFMGVEGRRRNLSVYTVASFVILGALGSLGYALSLFFTTILYTPLSVHSGDSRYDDTLFTPKPAVYYVPIVLSILGINALPTLLKRKEDVDLLRLGYVAVPLFLAFAPKIIPASWGQHHASKASAHRSFARAFFVLSLLSFALHWKNLGFAFFVNTPQKHSHVYDLIVNFGRKNRSKPDRFLTGLAITASKLKRVSQHPAISVTTSDIFFSGISLLAWAFTRDLDVSSILDNSILSFFAGHPAEKHVEFADQVQKPLEEIVEEVADIPTTTPKRRGRPKKADLTNGTSSATPSKGALRRSTRRKNHSDYESDAESTYKPSAAEREEVAQTEADGVPSEDLVHGGEATALGLALTFLGGLGQLSAGVLGAEVTSTN